MMHSHSNAGEFHSHTLPETRGNTIRWAHMYDSVVRVLTLGRDKRLREATVTLANIQPGDTVLDVGCGTGDLTLVAKTRAGSAGKVYGIDAAPEMIDVARRKALQRHAEVDFQVGVIERLAFPDQTFDVVLSSLMMHHLPGTLKRDGLAEIYRVLKPGGRVLIVDFKFASHSLAMMLHGNLDKGVYELAPIMQGVGFVRVETGDTAFRSIGYARGDVLK